MIGSMILLEINPIPKSIFSQLEGKRVDSG
jgi:hypothetical protein